MRAFRQIRRNVPHDRGFHRPDVGENDAWRQRRRDLLRDGDVGADRGAENHKVAIAHAKRGVRLDAVRQRQFADARRHIRIVVDGDDAPGEILVLGRARDRRADQAETD